MSSAAQPRPTHPVARWSVVALATAAFVVIVSMVVFAAVVFAAPTPQQACQAAKSKAAGKYAACRQTAEAKLATNGDVPKYTTAIAKCGTTFTTAWQKAIDKAALLGATCPDSALSASDYQTIITAHTIKVAGGLSGLGLQVCSASTRKKTGQTTCYDGAGASIPCATTGQDGELQKGIAHSYTDNGDGTITDNITGLMWEKLGDDGSIHDKDNLYTWANAFSDKVATLNSSTFAGYTDWRLPNINELHSLTNYTLSPATDTAFNAGCVPTCTIDLCSCTAPSLHWSSTTFDSNRTLAWGVSFGIGLVDQGGKGSGVRVRAVRESCAAAARPLKTGQVNCYDSLGNTISCENTKQDGDLQAGVARSYTDNGDGTITDNNTGLTWEKLGNDGSIHDKDTVYPWATAFTAKIDVLNSTVFAGHDDWRLPNINELQSIVNYGATNPAVSSIFHSGCAGLCANTACSCSDTGFYWTSTTSETAPSGAWGSFFSIGEFHFGSKAPGDYVRAVRGGS